MLCVAYEAVTERVFGRTYALNEDRRYQQWMQNCRALWQPVFIEDSELVPALAAPSSVAVVHESVSTVD